MSPAAARPPFAVVRATYDVSRWIVVIVQPNREDRGSTATAFDLVDAVHPAGTTLWAAIVARAHVLGIRLGAHGPEVISPNAAVHEWTDVAIG